MYIERNEEFNLLYINLRDKREDGDVARTKEIVPGAYLDLDSDDRILGIEIVNTETVLGIPVSDLHLSGELLGVKEAAQLAGKDRANFLRDLARKPDFPEPVAHLASGQVWLSKDIERYLEEKRNNRAEEQQRVNQAAEEFTNALTESFRAASELGVDVQEQNAQLTQQFFNQVIDNLRTQAEDTQQMGQQLAGQQQQRATEAGRTLTQESVDAYMDFLNSMFTFGQQGAQAAQSGAEEAPRGAKRRIS